MARGDGRVRLRVLGYITILAVLVLLDIRDLWFKWRWLGPDESYQWTSTVTESLLSSPSLTLANHVNVSLGQRHEHAFMTGWSGFFSQCDTIDGYHGSYFLHVRGRCQLSIHDVYLDETVESNHSISNTNNTMTLYLSGGVRPDSMAWVACQLLLIHRRPPLCHDNMVVDFQRRYAFTTLGRPLRHEMAEPMSEAEAELLGLLEVLSKSAPLSAVVCVEGIEETNSTTTTHATTFGCASPNLFISSFVGRYATGFAKLHQPLAWLTVHDVNVLGMHYVVRQNAISEFVVEPSTQTMTHISHVNLSSSGVLYHLLVFIDLILFSLHFLSALHLAKLYMTQRTSSSTTVSFLLTSLYRSTPVIWLTIVSQLLSWVLVLPATVIWSWSDTWNCHIHALLTVIRLWVLVLLILRAGWYLFVRLATEAKAYAVLRRTYVSSLEIICLTIVVLISLRSSLRTVRELKYAVDHQRLTDTSTFIGRKVFSNAYQDLQDAYDDYAIVGGSLTDRTSVLMILYRPFLLILCVSWIGSMGIVLARYYYNQNRNRTTSTDKPLSPTASTASSYARLPAEDLLDTPIRAIQLVRSHLSLEQTMVSTRRFLRSEQFLEHGIVLEQEQYLRTRIGFINVVQPKIQLDDHTIVGQRVEPLDPSDSPTKRRRMSAHIPSLR